MPYYHLISRAYWVLLHPIHLYYLLKWPYKQLAWFPLTFFTLPIWTSVSYWDTWVFCSWCMSTTILSKMCYLRTTVINMFPWEHEHLFFYVMHNPSSSSILYMPFFKLIWAFVLYGTGVCPNLNLNSITLSFISTYLLLKGILIITVKPYTWLYLNMIWQTLCRIDYSLVNDVQQSISCWKTKLKN